VATLAQNPILTSGTANGVAFLNASKVLTTGSALVFDGSNLGLSVTPSAWGSAYRAVQVGYSTAFVGQNTDNNAFFTQNLYYDGTNFNAIRTGNVSYYQQYIGQHRWFGTNTSYTAGATASLTQFMTLDASGNLGVGTTSPATYGKLVVSGVAASAGIESWIQNQTDTGGDNTRYAGLNFSVGSDTSTAAIRVYRTNSATNYENAMVFYTKGTGASPTVPTERMRLDSAGNLGIGATANASAILDAQSTTKGVRFPNMTTTQKNAISSPAAGLVVFDTTLSKLCVYSGAAWQTITSV
jgi:hypothetical protein